MRTETLAVALAAVALFAVYVWAARYCIEMMDEGYFLYLASRVAVGDLPYRDFDTYYTPGIFYLYAATFKVFGVGVEPIRILMSLVRVAWAVSLYRLTRRVAPWPFALLPFVVVSAADAVPISPEPHPSWIATLAVLIGLELLVRHQRDPRTRWMVAAGVAAGASFAFKQNVGAFMALAIGGYLLLRERRSAGRLVRIAQSAYALFIALAATFLLWPGLDIRVVAALWLPLLATLALLLISAWRHAPVAPWTVGVVPLVRDALAAGAAFVLVTLLWLVPLILALGMSGTPFGLFVGAVNQGALILPMPPPPPATMGVLLAAIWLPVLVAAALCRSRGRPNRWAVAGASLATLAVAGGVYALGPADVVVPSLREDPNRHPWLGYLDQQLNDLYVYLPSLGAWLGLIFAARVLPRGGAAEPIATYLLVGMLALLALYPRMDAAHAMFAGPPVLVVGAWGLSRVYRALTRREGRLVGTVVFASLLLVPVAGVAPHAYWRYVSLADPDPRAVEATPYVPLDLVRARVLAPRNVADNVRGAVRFVQAGTPVGEPFFAYPVAPMFHFLADRANPTMFNHFIPGALTPDDHQGVIRDLDRAKPRYVLWDHGGVVTWGTEGVDRVLFDYIWGCYGQVANFPPYLILERRCP